MKGEGSFSAGRFVPEANNMKIKIENDRKKLFFIIRGFCLIN
jgi:hypothetical protein